MFSKVIFKKSIFNKALFQKVVFGKHGGGINFLADQLGNNLLDESGNKLILT